MNLNFIINAPSVTTSLYYSLLEKMVNSLKKISDRFGNVESAELQLYETFEDENMNDKVAILTINCHDKLLTHYSLSKNWEDAVLTAFDSVYYNAAGRFN